MRFSNTINQTIAGTVHITAKYTKPNDYRDRVAQLTITGGNKAQRNLVFSKIREPILQAFSESDLLGVEDDGTLEADVTHAGANKRIAGKVFNALSGSIKALQKEIPDTTTLEKAANMQTPDGDTSVADVTTETYTIGETKVTLGTDRNDPKNLSIYIGDPAILSQAYAEDKFVGLLNYIQSEFIGINEQHRGAHIEVNQGHVNLRFPYSDRSDEEVEKVRDALKQMEKDIPSAAALDERLARAKKTSQVARLDAQEGQRTATIHRQMAQVANDVADHLHTTKFINLSEADKAKLASYLAEKQMERDSGRGGRG